MAGIAAAAVNFAASPSFAGTIVNNNDPAWVWTGMKETPNDDIIGGSGRAGGPAACGVYTFTGTGITVYAMKGPAVAVDQRAHKTGKLKITVDGKEQDTVNLVASEAAYNTKVYTVSGLTDTPHVIQLDPVGGWAMVEYVEVSKPESAETSAVTAPEPKSAKRLFSTNFDNGDVSAWTPFGGNWVVYNGKYCASAGPGNKSLISGSDYSNFTMDADIAVDANGDAGMVFDVTNPGVGLDTYNGYYAGLDASHQQIVLGKATNSWTVLAHQPYSIQADVVYHLRVVAKGNGFGVYINGQYVTGAYDDSFSHGAVGVRTMGTAVSFDNVKVAASE